jgi:hypothetical protein
MNKLVIVVGVATLWLAAACGGTGRPPAAAPASSATSSPAVPSPSRATSAPAAATSPGSTVLDVSFVSTARGWALGTGRLLTTADGGSSWTALPPPPAGTQHIRFASSLIGYAWSDDGSLWLTTDGARGWRSAGLTQVSSLETAAGLVWAIAGQQPYPNVWRAPVASTEWTNLGYTPNRSATLTVHGDTAYVLGQQGAGPISPSLDVWAGTQPVQKESLPCAGDQVSVPMAPLGASTDRTLVLVCDRLNQTATQTAFLSTNQGLDWTQTSAPPQPPVGVAAVPGRLFAWANDVLIQTGGHWAVSLAGPASGGDFSLVGFEDNTQGVALNSDGEFWMTRDGGTTWSQVVPRA